MTQVWSSQPSWPRASREKHATRRCGFLMAPRTHLHHNDAMNEAARIPSAPLRLSLDEARALRDAAFRAPTAAHGSPFLSAMEKLDRLIVGLDERAKTLPPPISIALPRDIEDPYCQPWMVALRRAPGASVCIDEECGLSGSRAHVGDCEPCGCPMQHAIAECPLLRKDVCGSCKGRGVTVCRPCCGAGVFP